MNLLFTKINLSWNVIILLCILTSCGRAYFPIELNTISRSERNQKQEDPVVEVVSMTRKSIKTANLKPYKRKVIDASNLTQPAKILPLEQALVEVLPKDSSPGPYLIGKGDVLRFAQILNGSSLVSRDIIVKDDGMVNIIDVGRIKAEGFTQSQLEDSIFEALLKKDKNRNFELDIVGFNSKKIFVISDDFKPRLIKYTATPMYLEGIIANLNLKIKPGSDMKIILLRKGKEYVLSLGRLLKSSEEKYRLFPSDKVLINPLNYRVEKVLIVGETGAQKAVQINSLQRTTLSEALFSNPILNNVTSDFSQIYVLRKSKTNFYAYHLDITNPARVSLSSEFEMRPDDIIFVATQPLSLYSRTLSQILGSANLTIQARDTLRSEIRN